MDSGLGINRGSKRKSKQFIREENGFLADKNSKYVHFLVLTFIVVMPLVFCVFIVNITNHRNS